MAKSLPCNVGFIEPMYALGVRRLAEGTDWLYEIKLDGFDVWQGRVLADGMPRLLQSRARAWDWLA